MMQSRHRAPKINIVLLDAASFYNVVTYKDRHRYDISSLQKDFPTEAKIFYLEDLKCFLDTVTGFG